MTNDAPKPSAEIIASAPKFAFENPSDKSLSRETRAQLATQIKTDINRYCVELYGRREPSRRMPASELAHECARYLYLKFRWAKQEPFDGRMLRLFDRGNREEERFLIWLRGIGFQVWDIDPNASDRRLNRQFRLRACRGHVGGFLDGIGLPPYIDLNFLLEFKTFATGPFQKVVKNGVAMERPKHYGQMCTYGKEYGFRYALYFPINKNDDDLHVECVELDWAYAEDLNRKADHIISAKVPPPKIAESAAFWQCKGCDFSNICHEGAAVDRNCRSCQNSEPIDDSKWRCNLYGQEIPDDFIPKGCDQHAAIVGR
jgi:hypothetical protein